MCAGVLVQELEAAAEQVGESCNIILYSPYVHLLFSRKTEDYLCRTHISASTPCPLLTACIAASQIVIAVPAASQAVSYYARAATSCPFSAGCANCVVPYT